MRGGGEEKEREEGEREKEREKKRRETRFKSLATTARRVEIYIDRILKRPEFTIRFYRMSHRLVRSNELIAILIFIFLMQLIVVKELRKINIVDCSKSESCVSSENDKKTFADDI